MLEGHFEGVISLLEFVAKHVECFDPLCDDWVVRALLEDVQQASELIMLESDIREGRDHVQLEGAPALLLALSLFED